MDQPTRKDRIRAYHEAPRPMGIYRVHSAASGRGVVGVSRDLPSSLNRQRAQLSLGSHPDRALQEEWDARGPDGFVFEVLDTLAPREDPGYDPSADLEALRAMWEERIAGG